MAHLSTGFSEKSRVGQTEEQARDIAADLKARKRDSRNSSESIVQRAEGAQAFRLKAQALEEAQQARARALRRRY